MVKYANKKRRDLEFVVGDYVFLKLRPHRQSSVANRICPTLSVKYFSPFQVTSRVGVVAYKLKLPVSSGVDPIFHISQLKKAIGNHPIVIELPAHLDDQRNL